MLLEVNFYFCFGLIFSQLLNTLRAMNFGDTLDVTSNKFGRIRWPDRASVGRLWEDLHEPAKLLGMYIHMSIDALAPSHFFQQN